MTTNNKTARRTGAKKQCANCGQSFGETKMFNRRRFCSSKCRSSAFYKRLKQLAHVGG